jgi:hypothetical protein
MMSHLSNAFWLGALALAALMWSGCASVQSTAQYYMPYTTKVYPPKPHDAFVPILGKAPPEKFTAIGKLAFETDLGWKFLRKSMVYNAQINGADAVVVKKVATRQQVSSAQVPPRVDWVPVPGYYRGRHGRIYGSTQWVPYFQPGYVQHWVDQITAIDAEMIVIKK